MKKDYSLKGRYNLSSAELVGGLVEGFSTEEYVDSLDGALEDLEYKDRLMVMVENFHKINFLSFRKTMESVISRLPSELPTDAGSVVKYIHVSVIVKYVEIFGQSYPKDSLNYMEELTKRNTCEHAVRPFLHNHYELTYAKVIEWCDNSSFHVRRLACESIRPFLPWSPVFRSYVENPTPIIPVLDKLYDDDSLYVRRSVANNLNDISKISPVLALECTDRWLSKNDSANVQYVVNHGLRTINKNK